jgi:serine/threonine protein kinase
MAPENESSWRHVAVKKSKLNAFNDRDGIQFYALREIQILQKLAGQKNIVRILDLFFNEKDNSICIVLEYLPTSL